MEEITGPHKKRKKKSPLTKKVPHRHAYLAILYILFAVLTLFWATNMVANGEALSGPGTVGVPRNVEVATKPIPEPVAKPSGSTVAPTGKVADQIRKIAKEEGYRAPEFLVRLAQCESSLNPLAKNKNSSATGLWQILDAHGLTKEQRTDIDFSTRWTISKLMDGKAGWWVCTKMIS